ncbi:MAG: hypothetical protein P4L40_13940 [Terracidiphilus sp.]|nr:hypothetical protein [Terracidiphilus sp.]
MQQIKGIHADLICLAQERAPEPLGEWIIIMATRGLSNAAVL